MFASQNDIAPLLEHFHMIYRKEVNVFVFIAKLNVTLNANWEAKMRFIILSWLAFSFAFIAQAQDFSADDFRSEAALSARVKAVSASLTAQDLLHLRVGLGEFIAENRDVLTQASAQTEALNAWLNQHSVESLIENGKASAAKAQQINESLAVRQDKSFGTNGSDELRQCLRDALIFSNMTLKGGPLEGWQLEFDFQNQLPWTVRSIDGILLIFDTDSGRLLGAIEMRNLISGADSIATGQSAHLSMGDLGGVPFGIEDQLALKIVPRAVFFDGASFLNFVEYPLSSMPEVSLEGVTCG